MTNSPHSTLSPDAFAAKVDILACCAENLTQGTVWPELRAKDFEIDEKDFARRINWLAVKITESSDLEEKRMLAQMGQLLSKSEEDADNMLAPELHFLFTEILQALSGTNARKIR